MEKISLKAPAKINLYLKILSERPDGFHELETLMQAIDLYDDITLSPADEIEFSCDDSRLPVDFTNLAVRAAIQLRDKYYFPGVKIHLSKKIPYGSGLGGGSSDAAFVIRGIVNLYQMKIPGTELLSIAASIGSDVSFFLSNGQALARGRGEIIEPVNMPLNYHVIVIMPPVFISTAQIYKLLKNSLTSTNANILLNKKLDDQRFMRLSERFTNDLEHVVLSQAPELSVLRRYLSDAGCFFCSMSGSGSAFYGLFSNSNAKLNNEEELEKQGYRIYRARPVLMPLI